MLVVRYDEMMSDFEAVMEHLMRFAELEPTVAQRQAITTQAEAQRSYQSNHSYDLSVFGLDEARIRADCAFFYEAFLDG